jgi:shikimate dehydrogenase
MIQAGTKLFAILGDPVDHSLSPSIQNPAFEAAGVDGVYVALRCGRSELPGLLRGIAQGGGGGNVTLPHKEQAAGLVDQPSERVRKTGACNTFWLSEDRIHGDNTDVAGFRGAVASLLGGPPEGLRALLLGAGGASRAALVGLLEDGARSVSIWNRTLDRAEQLSGELGEGRTEVIRSSTELSGEPYDLIVNSTSVGLSDEGQVPIDLDTVAKPGAVLDLVYRPRETAWVRAARERGIPAADGGEMLVRQGAEAFERWWGQPAPVGVMMAALTELRQG